MLTKRFFLINAVYTGIKERWGDRGMWRSGDEKIGTYQESPVEGR
jgi:hypothetical protein